MFNNIRRVALAGAFGIAAIAAPQMASAADAANGEKIFRKCATCHVLEEGGRKIGPSLYGVFGRTSGTLEGFRYSKAMQDAGVVWSEETIDEYLADPRGYIKGNRMAFVGLRKAEDRADLIAYLKTATAAE